jgi:GNAT superfamily N-acetyltransferase
MDEQTELRIRPLGEPGDLGWVVMAHGEVYAEQFGWNAEMEAMVARIVADYAADHDPAREAGWIAEKDGERVGSVFCVASDDPSIARLRILLVTASARGLGLGGQLVRTCLDFATEVGYREITLWTNDVLTSARRIYEAAGFTLVDQDHHHSFGQDLTGQTWSLRLSPSRRPPKPDSPE